MTADENTYLWGKRAEVVYDAMVSYAYHRRRQRFFDLADKLTKSAGALLGAGVLAKLGGQEVMAYLGALITGLSLTALVFSYSDKKQSHKDLADRFMRLKADIDGKGERDFVEDDIKAWSRELQLLNAQEPPTLATLVTICQNEVNTATGHAERVVPVPWMKRRLAGVFSF